MDLHGLGEQEQPLEYRRLASAEIEKPFDLTADFPLRTLLIRLGEHEHILVITLHHIAADGWSMGVLVSQLSSLYRAFSTGHPSPLLNLPIQYADYAQWQRQWLEQQEFESQIRYWKRQLADLPVIELPTDRPRPHV